MLPSISSSETILYCIEDILLCSSIIVYYYFGCHYCYFIRVVALPTSAHGSLQSPRSLVALCRTFPTPLMMNNTAWCTSLGEDLLQRLEFVFCCHGYTNISTYLWRWQVSPAITPFCSPWARCAKVGCHIITWCTYQFCSIIAYYCHSASCHVYLQDQYTLTACAVLLEYLCDTVVAPLQRDMVEIEHPYCNRVS